MDCYHCGLPLPDPVDRLSVTIQGQSRQMCCTGCATVAQAIVDNGLADYYRTRDAMPESPREAKPDILGQLSLYDHAEFQKTFVRTLAEHEREASLLLEGITCAACVWLNEQHLAGLPGVQAVDINYATRRTRIRWDDTQIKLSGILKAVQQIGYNAHPYDASRTEQLARDERRSALWRVWVAGFGMMQVMMYAFPVYIADGEMTADVESLMRWASLLLTFPVIIYSAAPFFKHAWRDLKMRRAGMDVPVALGVGAAFSASVWATVTQSGDVYFDSVTMFIFFLLGGRYLEMTARQKAVSVTEALARLQPAFAERIDGYPEQREAKQVMVAELSVGSFVLVRPGAQVPADGIVIEGNSHVDESLLTGESSPVAKRVGSQLTGGSLNIDSPLTMQVNQVGEETWLSSIVQLMERAGLEKPKLVELADRVASRFVSVLLVVAFMVGLVWYWLDPSQALWITVSVLVVTCPCALSLATPIALTVSAGALAKDGLLVTRGHAIETLARANHFVFDKTGTLTTGQMTLLETNPVETDQSSEQLIRLAAALEQHSEHPIAKALRSSVKEHFDLPVFENVQSIAGMGMEGLFEGRRYRVGKPEFVAELSGHLVVLPETLKNAVETVVALGDARAVLAYFRIGDVLRADAVTLIRSLQASGHQITLLSGDAESVAKDIGARLGILDIHAGVLPDQKHAFVQALQAQGKIVAMVGDGVNDAPVLAQAQVSLAMGNGAQLARTQADIILLSENLTHLAQGIDRAKFSLLVIKQNLWWSFAYNFIALPLAMVGWVTPWLAGIGMSLSSLLVVLNSLRIQRREMP